MKTSIYLPAELARQVREHSISVSEVSQKALWAAVQEAGRKETAVTDLEQVADRIRATLNKQEALDRVRGHTDGVDWARNHASARELEVMDRVLEHISGLDPYRRWWDDDSVLASLVEFIRDAAADDDWYHEALELGWSGPYVHGVTITGSAYWMGFAEGATEVWSAVRPML